MGIASPPPALRVSSLPPHPAHCVCSERIAKYLGLTLSSSAVGTFADGEVSIKVEDSVRGMDVFIIQPTCKPVNQNLMELLLLISTMRRASAGRITAVIPYYGYSRQDRKMASRVPIGAADVAHMLEALGVDRVIAIDLHTGQIQGFFSPRVPVDNLAGSPVGAAYFAEKRLHNPVVVSPDAGGVYRAQQFRAALVRHGYADTGIALLVKQRAGPGLSVTTVVGDVSGHDVIIVDDMIDTASTLSRAAHEVRKLGALNIYAFATHGLFSGNAPFLLERAPISEIVVSDTIPLAPEMQRVGKVRQLTLAPLLAEAIRRTHLKQSLSGSLEFRGPLPSPDAASSTPAVPVVAVAVAAAVAAAVEEEEAEAGSEEQA
jgi:ribose-phosphate pyrophosphokinase